MTVGYLTDYNTRCNGVTFPNNGWIKVQPIEDISDHENNIYCVNSLETFLRKSEVCDMTLMSGTFDGKTILFKIS